MFDSRGADNIGTMLMHTVPPACPRCLVLLLGQCNGERQTPVGVLAPALPGQGAVRVLGSQGHPEAPCAPSVTSQKKMQIRWGRGAARGEAEIPARTFPPLLHPSQPRDRPVELTAVLCSALWEILFADGRLVLPLPRRRARSPSHLALAPVLDHTTCVQRPQC